MTYLNWDNLKEKQCPRCNSEMVLTTGTQQDGSIIKKMVCSAYHDPKCHFTMPIEKFQSIVRFGTYKQSSTIKFAWQNLHDGRCPVCKGMLRDINGRGVLNCETQTCDFRIRERRLQEILTDNTHAANRFRGVDAGMEDENFEALNNL